MSTILRLESVTKKFSGLVAVNKVSFDVEENTIHALIGPNGSGKTTTLNLIHGVLEKTEGTIKFQDKDITNTPTYEIAQMGLGRTFQNIKLFDSMTALENVMLGAQFTAKLNMLRYVIDIPSANKQEKHLVELSEEVLNTIGLYDIKDEHVKNLPYGKRKILEIGRTLVSNPKMILLDEPAAGLNPSERAELVKVLNKIIGSGITILMIEHNMDVVMNICNKLTVLNFGSKIAEGTPHEIQNNDEVIKAYLGAKYQKNL